MGFSVTECYADIIKYLDISGHFKELLKCIEMEKKLEHDQDSLPILSFRITIDFSQLSSISDNVASIILREPLMAQELFSQVTQLALETERRGLHNVVDIQLLLNILAPTIPSIMAFTGKVYLPSSGLFVIKGVLTACALPTKYCKSAVFKCSLEGCSGNKGQRVFDGRVSTSICNACGHKLEEFLRARVNGDEVIGMFNQPEGFQLNFKMNEGICVCLRDELTNNLSLGTCYNVVSSIRQAKVYAWGINETISENQWRFDNNVTVAGIPPEIVELENHVLNSCPRSPWAFTACLCSQLCSDLYPINSLFHLKIGILLSLSSQKYDEVPVPLLAVGPDCYPLLQVSSQLARRRLVVSSTKLSGPVGGSVGPLWLEAGPLQLASGGVCYLGDWAKFSSGRGSTAAQIIAALEKSRVDMVISNNSSVGSPPSQPLRAAVWTYWSGDKVTTIAQTQLQTLIEVFGMPFIGDASDEIEAVVKHLLSKAVNHEHTENTISKESLKKYIEIICNYKVQLTPEASRLLRNYFVASRRERPDCLPLTAIKTMTALAEAHARLCLRTQVLVEDVIIVVYLYEISITALFGPSLMSSTPIVQNAINLRKNENIGTQLHIILQDFSAWLDQYIKSFLSECSVNGSISEE